MTRNIHNTCLLRSLLVLLLAIVTMCAGSAYAQSRSTMSLDPLNCLGSADEVQGFRDNLAVAGVYLKTSKDNFGPARQRAIDSVKQALGEFERLHGEPQLLPTSGKEKAPYLGSHGHPRMHRALMAIEELESALNVPACRSDNRLDTLRQEISKAKMAINDAFIWNPPYSRH